MWKLVATLALGLVLGGPAIAQSTGNVPPAKTLGTVPESSVTVTNYYKQNVYDPGQNKIGEIKDVLVNNEGRITAFIVSVGGFLGVNEKDVAVPFSSVKAIRKDDKWYLTMSTSKDELKNAKGFRYDRTNTKWVGENA